MARSDNFSRRFEILSSELPVSTNCKLQSSSKQTNHPARKKCSQQCTISLTRIDKPKINKSIKVNLAPASISDKELEDNICKALSLTGHLVIPDDLQACHQLKKRRL